MFKNRFSLILFFLLLLFALFVLLQTKIYTVTGEVNLDKSYERELLELGGAALQTLDVPVGAILTYQDEIIGRGFNTVRSDQNLAGHAEINALNNALQQMGLQKFNQLNRKELILYTTFEPCEMCKGALIHYNIRKVRVVKSKSLSHWWRVNLKQFRYELGKRKTGDEYLQDSLFLIHPDYPGDKK